MMNKKPYLFVLLPIILAYIPQANASFHPDPDTCSTGRLCDAIKECDLYVHKAGDNEILFNYLVQNSEDPLVRQYCTISGFVV